jgi:hypothetical protein
MWFEAWGYGINKSLDRGTYLQVLQGQGGIKKKVYTETTGPHP